MKYAKSNPKTVVKNLEKKVLPKSRFMYAIYVSIGISVIFTVFVTLAASTSGAEITRLESVEDELSRKNQEYSERIVEATSLINIGKNAEKLGFIKPEKIVYISSQDSVAQAR